MNKIITKDIKEEIIVIPSTEYAYIEIYTTVKGIAVYNGSIWGIQQITLNEDGMLKAKVNNDPSAILLHNVKDIHIANTTTRTLQYRVWIEYDI